MTTQPPSNIADCTALVNEAFAALVASGLTPEQTQHLGTMANAYLFALKHIPKATPCPNGDQVMGGYRTVMTHAERQAFWESSEIGKRLHNHPKPTP